MGRVIMKLADDELAFIRTLEDFDLQNFLLEIDEFGLIQAQMLLTCIKHSIEAQKKDKGMH